MKKQIQVVLFGLICTAGGWLAAHCESRTRAEPAKPEPPAAQVPAGFTNLYANNVQPRAADELHVTDKTKKLSVEVYRDENNGNLIYVVAETGSIAVVAGAAGTGSPGKPEPK